MAMTKAQVLEWLESIPEGNLVAIDDGGLSLVELSADGEELDAFLEVGGIPDPEDDPDESPHAAPGS